MTNLQAIKLVHGLSHFTLGVRLLVVRADIGKIYDALDGSSPQR